MNKPFHYKPLSEVIAEYEKDPEKKKLLDEARERLTLQAAEHAQIQPIEFDIPLWRYQLAQDIDEAAEQDDRD